MDKFSRRESPLLGYSPQRSLINHTSSPKTPYIDSDDVDFNDVFGGPPRRSSIHDVRHSFSQTLESPFRGDSEAPRFGDQWSGLIEKPVFGEEIENRRRYHSDDFFDDIFRNDDSVSSMPRKNGRDPFASSPDSRVLSPVRPLPPKSLLPQQFSLSPKLAKGTDLPTFGSATCSLYNNKDGTSNGASYSHSPNTSLSRLSSQRQQSRNGVLTSHHQCPLYNEFLLCSEGSSNLTFSGKTGTGSNSKEDSNGREVTINSNEFHFSIYKWASKGVPLLMPLGGANSSRLKQKGKFERCLSTKGRIESKSITAELPMRTPGSSDFSSTANTKSFSIEHAEQESNSLLVTRERLEPHQIVEEATFPILESDTPSRLQGNNEKTRKAGKEKLMVSKKSSVNVDVGKNVKKLHVKTTSFNNSKDNKASLQGLPMDSRDKLEGNRVKGKVKEFVNMFNQEASLKQKLDVNSRNQSSRWKKRSTLIPENGASVSTSRTSEKIHMPDVKKINLADASITADEDLKQSQKQQSTMVNYILSDIFLVQKDSSGSASISEGFKATVGDADKSFRGYLLVKELPQDDNGLPPIGKDPEDMEVANAKIQHWSKGKEGNIRSLLSTLQYVLWPESEWKPVPLADIIEGDAVKRAYKKTLLCLHPDKLQQKGASLHQKFIAEKVFDILQEAWIDFNTLSSL